MNLDTSKIVILVADDDDDIRGVVVAALSSLGYQVREARDGDQATQLIAEKLPDLAVLDISMPGLNGLEVCRRIKQSTCGELTPVIMLTALDGIKDKVRALDSGADDYLTKPFHLQELRARVKALLRVRALNVSLQENNRQLSVMQAKLVEHERQAVVMQLAGTAAHSLGQPLSAIMLNCHLLEKLPPTDLRYKKALEAVKQDAKRMAEMLEQLKSIDAKNTQEYYGATAILNLKDDDR